MYSNFIKKKTFEVKIILYLWIQTKWREEIFSDQDKDTHFSTKAP